MNHTTDTITAADGTALFTQRWLPDGQPKAVLFLAHGYAEHSGRYGHVATYLVERGYAVYAMDLRGHGLSGGLKGYIDSFEVLINDMAGHFRVFKAANADRPRFIMGHSIGGVLALLFTARHQADLSGVIISAAALSAGEAIPGYIIALARLFATLTPKLPLMALEGGMVSKDPAVIEAYNTDPLNYLGKVRARTGQQLLALQDATRREAPRITVPALLMHGGEDALINPASLDELYALLGSADKTKKLYDGLYHEIFNEPEKERVLADVAAWLDEHLI